MTMRNREGGVERSTATTETRQSNVVYPRQSIPLGIGEPVGGASIGSVSWDARKGAQEAIDRAESEARKQHQKELEQYQADPLVLRVSKLEAQVERLSQTVTGLVQKIEVGTNA